MMKLLVFLGLVCTVASKCCPPKQYEGFIGSYGGTCSPGGQAGLLTTWGSVHYDYDKAMVAIIETVSAGGGLVHIQVLQDYDNKVQYMITGGNCTKTDLQFTDSMCVPESATYVTSMVYGMSDMTVDVYSYDVPRMHGVSQIIVTRDKCVPFGANLSMDQPQASVVMSIGYANMTMGIKDPSVFDIPKICQHDDVMPFKDMDNNLSDRMKVVTSSYAAR